MKPGMVLGKEDGMAARKKTTKKKAVRRKATSSPPKKPARKPAQKPASKKGMPLFVPSPEQRIVVETLVGLGLTHNEIRSNVINPRTGKSIDRDTLTRAFATELVEGDGKLKARVLGSLAKKAMSADHPSSATAAIFMAKCRWKWRQEDTIKHEHSGTVAGVLVAPATMTAEEWVAEQEAKNTTREAPDE